MTPSTHRTHATGFTAQLRLVVLFAFLAGCERSAPPSGRPPPPPGAESSQTGQQRQKGASAVATAAEVLEDHWYRVVVGGTSAGVSHRLVERQNGNIHWFYEQKLKIRRGVQPLELGSRVEMLEGGDGKIQSFELVISASPETSQTIQGKVKGDVIEISRPAPTGSRGATVRVPLDPQARGLYWVDQQMTAALSSPGDTFTATTFFPERQRCGKIEAVAQSIETVDVGDSKQECLAVVLKSDVLPGMDTRVWIDGEGTVWKSQMKAMGMTVEELLSPTGRPTKNSPKRPELLFSTSIRPDRPLRNAGANDSVLYRFSLKEGSFASRGITDVFRGTGQTLVQEESPSSRLVRIRRVHPESKVEISSIDRSGKDSFLRPNPLIQSDDPEIIAAARQAIGDSASAFDAAQRLALWVHGAIRVKDLSVGFASAKETLQARQGDCTEHGVLLAALARAVTIPARVASGFIYHKGVFMGHMWTELYINRWIPFDATRGDATVGPDHILISASDLSNTMTSDVFFDLVPILGNLKIDILEP